MTEDENAALFARVFRETAIAEGAKDPVTRARIADRGARLTAAYSGAPNVGSVRAPEHEREDYALFALESGAMHGLDRVRATATLATQALRARDIACAYALERDVTGALHATRARVRAPDGILARRERAEHAAIAAVERRSRALDALARLRAAWKAAPSKRERDALRSRYRAACHRMGVRPE